MTVNPLIESRRIPHLPGVARLQVPEGPAYELSCSGCETWNCGFGTWFPCGSVTNISSGASAAAALMALMRHIAYSASVISPPRERLRLLLLLRPFFVDRARPPGEFLLVPAQGRAVPPQTRGRGHRVSQPARIEGRRCESRESARQGGAVRTGRHDQRRDARAGGAPRTEARASPDEGETRVSESARRGFEARSVVSSETGSRSSQFNPSRL